KRPCRHALQVKVRFPPTLDRRAEKIETTGRSRDKVQQPLQGRRHIPQNVTAGLKSHQPRFALVGPDPVPMLREGSDDAWPGIIHNFASPHQVTVVGTAHTRNSLREPRIRPSLLKVKGEDVLREEGSLASTTQGRLGFPLTKTNLLSRCHTLAVPGFHRLHSMG
ncbi:MAG: hypothetical protein ACKPKO_32345, partial [Candidatus Fonsibacter sp.]